MHFIQTAIIPAADSSKETDPSHSYVHMAGQRDPI